MYRLLATEPQDDLPDLSAWAWVAQALVMAGAGEGGSAGTQPQRVPSPGPPPPNAADFHRVLILERRNPGPGELPTTPFQALSFQQGRGHSFWVPLNHRLSGCGSHTRCEVPVVLAAWPRHRPQVLTLTETNPDHAAPSGGLDPSPFPVSISSSRRWRRSHPLRVWCVVHLCRAEQSQERSSSGRADVALVCWALLPDLPLTQLQHHQAEPVSQLRPDHPSFWCVDCPSLDLVPRAVEAA